MSGRGWVVLLFVATVIVGVIALSARQTTGTAAGVLFVVLFVMLILAMGNHLMRRRRVDEPPNR